MSLKYFALATWAPVFYGAYLYSVGNEVVGALVWKSGVAAQIAIGAAAVYLRSSPALSALGARVLTALQGQRARI